MHGCRTALACILGMVVVSCSPALPPAPKVPSDDVAFVDGRPTPKPGLEESQLATPDTLNPGDILSVRFLGSPEMDVPQTVVDRSGRLHLPLMGDIIVGGRTLTEAEASIQTELQRYDKVARVALNVIESKGRFATVTGAVDHPGNIALIGDARVADVIAAAGGPRSFPSIDRLVVFGDVDAARMVRNGNVLPIDVRLALSGDRRHNVRVRPQDVIYVPPALTGRVAVLGHVAYPKSLAFHEGLRLTEALADAGGLTRSADGEDVRVIRGGYQNPRIYVASVNDLFAGVRPDVVLAPGDIVYVSEHWFAAVGDVLDRVIPAAATYFLYRNLQIQSGQSH